MTDSRFTALLDGLRLGQLLPDELEELQAAIRSGQYDALIQEDIRVLLEQMDEHPLWTATRSDKLWQQLTTQTFNAPVEKPLQRIPLLKTAWFRYAAAVIILSSVGTFFWLNTSTIKPAIVHTIPTSPVNDIAPGGDKAILTLADGSTIVLDKADNGNLAQQGDIKIVKRKNGQVEYVKSGSTNTPESAVSYNTMQTPNGGQYQLTLPDGTRVLLNAASSVSYPVSFTGKQRIVSVTGEVYFEVAPDPAHPFIVKTYKEEIIVLGTAFNINSYTDEPAIKTSLLKGVIRINDRLLKPGEAYINGNIIPTDIAQDLAWKNGIFDFNHLPLKKVMKQLARWYDIEIVYEGEIPGFEFYGEAQRSLKLADVLEALSGMGVRFKIEHNRRLIVSKM
ncbi:FecR domain-containing protein [Chitinophaga sp. MM2321]|uniref:FecR family protein n=1 Tax=Chitinophaga sp. MM2321 TaxID=3137178 RepID=UPI0032D5A724